MKQQLFKTLQILGIPHLLRFYKSRNRLITILCLHRISDEDSVTIPPLNIKDFERLLQYLDKHYKVITLNEIANFNSSKPAVILSFDDGFFDFYENGLPLLKKYGFPCNANVITRCLDGDFQIWTQRLNNLLDQIFIQKHSCSFDLGQVKTNIDRFEKKIIFQQYLQIFSYLFKQDEVFVEKFLTVAESKMPFSIPVTKMMSWNNLIHALNTYDIELGSHSISHITLTNILQKERLYAEINDSKKIIETRTGVKVDIFAFPNGNYNEEVLNVCKEAGYKKMLTVDEKLLPPKNDNDFLFPRILIGSENYYENLLRAENFHNSIKAVIAKIKR